MSYLSATTAYSNENDPVANLVSSLGYPLNVVITFTNQPVNLQFTHTHSCCTFRPCNI